MVEETEKTKPKGSAWNLAQSFMNEIELSLMSASKYVILGNLKRAYFSLKAVKMRVVMFLDSDERKKFRKRERFIEHFLNKRSRVDVYDEEETKKWGFYTIRIQRGLEKYNDMIMDALQKYSLSIPEKQEEALF